MSHRFENGPFVLHRLAFVSHWVKRISLNLTKSLAFQFPVATNWLQPIWLQSIQNATLNKLNWECGFMKFSLWSTAKTFVCYQHRSTAATKLSFSLDNRVITTCFSFLFLGFHKSYFSLRQIWVPINDSWFIKIKLKSLLIIKGSLWKSINTASLSTFSWHQFSSKAAIILCFFVLYSLATSPFTLCWFKDASKNYCSSYVLNLLNAIKLSSSLNRSLSKISPSQQICFLCE